jgi:N-acetylneuraminic acid mutarotase
MAFSAVPTAYAQSGTFALTGSLNTARYNHTAALLQNGEVLVTGGVDVTGNPIASAELFNPTTGKWTVTGSMSEAREAFTATLLQSGEVLVAGGFGYFGDCLAAAELYNPSTGEWTPTGSMTQGRCSPSATLLPSGDVLVAGGGQTGSFSNTLTSAELYNPSTGAWQTTGSLNVGRSNAAAILENGQVLAAGGSNYSNGIYTLLASAELYNPATGLWTLTASMVKGTLPTTPVLLANTDVLIANDAQYYNPSTATWVNTGALPKTAGNPTKASFLNTGNVLASGTTCNYSGCGHVPTATCFLYTTSTNVWSLTGTMKQPRIDHTSTLLSSGQVLVAGGTNRALGGANNILSSAELYTP